MCVCPRVYIHIYDTYINMYDIIIYHIYFYIMYA